MGKLWHTSDIHLSFRADGTVQKDMSQRRWSAGSQNYVGYLDRLFDFGSQVIASNDFVVVTGDLTHDMKHAHAIHSFRTFRAKVNGTIIFIKGNHDSYINFGSMRMDYIGEKFFMIDEGEILTVGPYTFGCYSDHDNKSSSVKVNEYLDFAYRLAAHAKRIDSIPVMLSHYPVDANMAASIGKYGVKAYLSGHVHCTKGDAPDGNDWQWYDNIAKPTDDQEFNGCYFSTGTTDVLINKQNGQIYKEIKVLEVDGPASTKGKASLRSKAGIAFRCRDKDINKFENTDPFNPGNTIAGFLCRATTAMNGSLYITHVNGAEIEPQLVYGTPKLAYPYEEGKTEYKELPKAKYYFLANKWNGTNVLFYKYYDSAGQLFITAKTKGTATIKDSEFGNFLSLTREALGWHDYNNSIMKDLPSKLMPMMYDSYQSMSFELCGKKEPHLVKYDFDIDLKPLFFTREDGRISPFIGNHEALGNMERPFHYNYSGYVASVCRSAQVNDHETNEAYRKELGLPHKYEFEHFATEGKVLYLVDEDHICVDRTLYKIKPRDIEEVHWQTFDATMQGRVREALDKLGRDGLPPSQENIQKELDMGPKEWDKFGKLVMGYAAQNPGVDEREVLVLVGLPGCGKSTLAKCLEAYGGWVRVNQDELGSRNKCKEKMSEALKLNKKVVVDRCNFDVRQRKSWIDLAHSFGVKNIKALYINADPNTCKDRVVARPDHPTVAPVEGSKAIVDNFLKMMVPPTAEEGFVEIIETDGFDTYAHSKKILGAQSGSDKSAENI